MSAVEVIYSHRDSDGDALRVEHGPETIEVDAEDAHDGERVTVSLTHEEGIKLARAILAALDAEPEVGLTHQALDGMPEGTEVYDQDLEKWTKYGYQWKYYAGALLRSSVDLIEQYGPITAKAQAQ